MAERQELAKEIGRPLSTQLLAALDEARAERDKALEQVERFTDLAIDLGACSCTWDVDGEHPDIDDLDAEEPLKIVRPDPDCKLHSILRSEQDKGA